MAAPHPQLNMPLRVVFYQSEGRWIAHCLEFDLCGDGDTTGVALQTLSAAIELQVEDTLESGNLRNLFSPAESKYFTMFAAGKNVVIGDLTLFTPGEQAADFEISSIEAREFQDGDLAFV